MNFTLKNDTKNIVIARRIITEINADFFEILPEGRGLSFLNGWASSALISTISLIIYIMLDAMQKSIKPSIEVSNILPSKRFCEKSSGTKTNKFLIHCGIRNNSV